AATLSAYAIALIPFVMIRSAVATFNARKDTTTPMIAALTGIAVNVALKVMLMGSLAQIGLALGTAAGAWINLLLVIYFATRAGYLEFDRPFLLAIGKFVVAGIILAAALWGTARYAAQHLADMTTLRDEATLGILIVVTLIVYCASILTLFGRGWLRQLVRPR
ncbi:MAG: lipid II flippase MurJ, partial [Bradyrhizobiaceae bacterium]